MKLSYILGALYLLVCSILAVGWVMNLWQLFTEYGNNKLDITMVVILKVLGIFVPPIGGIMGFIGIL